MACCGTFLSCRSISCLISSMSHKNFLFKVIIAAVVAVYNLGFPSMIRDLHCTQFQATIGMSVFTLGFGVVPLVTSSFSEEFGRLPLYIVSGIGFFLMFPMIALYVKHIMYGHAKLTFYLSGQKTLRRSLWHAFYKARLGLRLRLWSEEPSLTYG
jgi:MFS family permease